MREGIRRKILRTLECRLDETDGWVIPQGDMKAKESHKNPLAYVVLLVERLLIAETSLNDDGQRADKEITRSSDLSLIDNDVEHLKRLTIMAAESLSEGDFKSLDIVLLDSMPELGKRRTRRPSGGDDKNDKSCRRPNRGRTIPKKRRLDLPSNNAMMTIESSSISSGASADEFSTRD